MNHDELARKLRALTEKELKYKSNPVISEKYKKMKIINCKGQDAYLFDDNDMKMSENITLLKHTRYVEVPMHLHTYIELSYVYSGEFSEIIKDKTITLKKGQISIIDTGIPHSILPTTENDIIINILMSKEYFSTSFLSRLSSKGIISEFLINAISDKKEHDNYIIFNSENNKKIPNYIRELLCEYFDKSLCSDEIIDCFMILIFSELLRVFQYDSNQTNTKSSNNAPIVEILHYLEKNYITCTLASTAKHFNFHPNYLSNLIKKTTNKSFSELILLQKLTRASILLENTNIPIYEIASEIGYNNLNFFYKKFKKHFGFTPNEFRENSISSYNKKLK